VTATAGWMIAAVIVTCMGATASLDQLVKQLRARHRIGVVAYSSYSRAADFHTGVSFYVPIIGGWVVMIPAAAIVGWRNGAAGPLAVAIAAMVVGLGAHAAVTGLRAAPILLSQRDIAPDDEPKLTAVFDRFARWHLVRTMIDVGTASSAVWALVAAID
jgi:hypothetical protein